MAVILTRQNMAASRSSAAGVVGDESTAAGPASLSESAAPIAAPPDDAVAKILKMVPGEVSVAYTAALALGDGRQDANALPLVAFILCAVLIPVLLHRDGKMYSPPVRPEPVQVLFQVLCFTAWAFSIKNPLAAWGFEVPVWVPALAMLFLPIFGGLSMPDRDPGALPKHDVAPGE